MLAFIASAGLCVSGAAAQEDDAAAEPAPKGTQGVYVYLGTGFSVVGEQNTDIPLADDSFRTADQDIQYEDAAIAEVALGYRFTTNIRAEVNASYRAHAVKDLPDSGHRGDIHAVATMANIFYDYPIGKGGGDYDVPMFVPYVGAGVGVLWTKPRSELEFPAGLKLRGESAEFAWNILLGVEVPITDYFGIQVGYRYLEAMDHRWNLRDGARAVSGIDGSYLAHEGRVGFRFGY
ncbi:MAG: outer membrane protein [Myxococcota bacterium]